MSRTGLDPATLANALRRMAGDGGMEWVHEPIQASVLLDVADMLDENARLREVVSDGEESARLILDESRALQADNDRLREYIERKRDLQDFARLVDENAKLREQLERVQPTDCEGNVLDIADKVHMLRSEYDGDHEWEDVVTELVLTKWGGDRWIVRGSKGEAWACDCTKTGYDEDAYEASDDVEPFDEPTLLEVENTKLRELLRAAYNCTNAGPSCLECRVVAGGCTLLRAMRELGIEAGDGVS